MYAFVKMHFNLKCLSDTNPDYKMCGSSTFAKWVSAHPFI